MPPKWHAWPRSLTGPRAAAFFPKSKIYLHETITKTRVIHLTLVLPCPQGWPRIKMRSQLWFQYFPVTLYNCVTRVRFADLRPQHRLRSVSKAAAQVPSQSRWMRVCISTEPRLLRACQVVSAVSRDPAFALLCSGPAGGEEEDQVGYTHPNCLHFSWRSSSTGDEWQLWKEEAGKQFGDRGTR